MKKIFFLTILGAWKSKIKVPSISMSGEDWFSPVFQGALLLHPHTLEDKGTEHHMMPPL
jgi:hypothetical protein